MSMKLRWWIIGMVAVAAGSVFMIKHIVDNKKTDSPFVQNNNEKSDGAFPHEILETDFDDADFIV